MDTIYAAATARGKSGVAIVRLSGPMAHVAVAALSGPLPEIRMATLRKLVCRGVPIDECLVLLFKPGHSFTGEAVAELHVHGSIAVIAATLRALSEQPGLRMAEPGEFTRRALENGCLDLAQIEGLAALIDAETELQRKQALRVLSGAVGKRAETWRKHLIRAAALLEASIDFVDEDVPVNILPEVAQIVSSLLTELRTEAAGAVIAERVRDGFEVAIIGAPNAGKSTLLNALAGREAAITSEFAGTTRDVIEVRMDLAGLPVTLLDTAGLRDAADVVEGMGIDRALVRAEAADIRVFLTIDGKMPDALLAKAGDIIVEGKADLALMQPTGLAVSGKTGVGIPQLIAEIGARLERRVAASMTLTHARHRTAALSAITALETALVEIGMGACRTELVAENLRRAIRSLDSLVGRIDVENLLDEIFASFCIGK